MKRKFALRWLLISFCFCWETSPAARAATLTWNNPAGGNWNEPNNWTPNAVPRAGDSVVIAMAGVTNAFTVTLDVNANVDSLWLGVSGNCAGLQALSLNGKTLTLNGPLTITDCGLFNLDRGTLKGSTNASISGLVTWTGGVLNGNLTLTTNGVLLMAGTNDTCELYGALTNQGTVKLVAGSLDFYGNYVGMLVNLPGGMVDIQTDLTITSYNSRGTFFNWGILRKSAGQGTATVRPDFYNYGTVDSESGTLSFTGGGSLNAGSSFVGSGVAELKDGTFVVNDTVTGSNGTFSGAGVTGTNGVLGGQWVWKDGNIDAKATLTIATNGILNLAGPTDHNLVLYGMITNAGVLNLDSGALVCQGNLEGLLINLPGARIDFRSDLAIHNYNNRGAVLNWGTVRKSGGTGVSILDLEVQNHGTSQVDTGTIAYTFTGSSFEDGSQFTGTGTNLLATGGSGRTVLNDNIYSENLELGGTRIIGASILSGQARWTSARLEDGASLTIATNGTLVLEGLDDKVIVGVLHNEGTILNKGTGRIAMGSLTTMAAIDNRAGAVFDISGDGRIEWTGYSQPAFTNSGIVRKSAGLVTEIKGVLFSNSGRLDAREGTTIAYETSGSRFEDGTRFLGNGTNLLAAGAGWIWLNGAIYSENLELGSTRVLGTNALSGKIYWTKGLIEDGCVLNVAHNGILILTGPDDKGSLGVINNEGGMLVYGTGRISMGSKTHPAMIVNRVGGLFDLVSDAPVVWGGESQPTFTNAGTFRKSGGTGVNLIDGVLFYNNGTLLVQSGTIAYTTSGSIFDEGTRFLGSGTNLLAAGAGWIRLNGSIYSDNLELGSTRITGTITLNGTVRWTKAVLGESTVMTIPADGLLLLPGPDDKGSYGLVDNFGTIQMSGTGRLAMASKTTPAAVNNRAGALFETTTDAPIAWGADSQPAFTNAGTFRKTGSTGTTSFDGVVFYNTGTVDTQTGTIAYTTSGSRFENGSRLTGNGTNLLTGNAVFNLNGSIYSENLELGPAIITGSNTLSGKVYWTKALLGEAAVLTVAHNGVLMLTGPDDKGSLGTINNLGRILVSGTGRLGMGSRSQMALINNGIGGLFDFASDASIAWTSDGQPGFTNAGYFRKSLGTNVSLINGVIFHNTGTVDAQSGIISFNTSGSAFEDGSKFIGSGRALLSGGTIALNGSIESENLLIGGATLVGACLLNGTASWSAGLIAAECVLTVTTNAVFDITGSDQKAIIGVLDNQGLVRLSGTGTLAMGSQTTVAVLKNEVTGTFEASSSAPIAWTGLSQPLFSNLGLFRKTDQSITTVSLPFMNEGTIDVQNGVLSLASTYSLAGGKLNFGINGPTNWGRLSFSGSASLTGDISANLRGEYQPRSGDLFPVIGYTARSGMFSQTNFPACAAWQTNYEATTFSLQVLNARPSLANVPPQQVDELKTLTVTNSVSHPDGDLQTVKFALISAPSGTLIDTNSGIVCWTPAQTQSPSTNLIWVRVTDTGNPPLSSSNSFVAIVREVNMPPVLPLLPIQTVDELTTLRTTNTATEPNIHSVTIGYGLVQSPLGAEINSSGIITWRPSQEQSPSTNLLVTVVTNANPYDTITSRLLATNTITVVVKEINVAPVLSPVPTQVTYELSLLTVTNQATESNIHSTVGYRLENPPAGMTIGQDGIITWIPNHDQAPATNEVVTVATNSNPSDLVHPSLSATNRFTVIVLERPSLTAATVTTSGFQFTVLTVAGQTYTVQYSTDLQNWTSKSTFEGYGGPLTIKDRDWTNRPACFYRLQIVPQ